MDSERSISELMSELSSPESPSNATLAELSCLDAGEIDIFKSIWSGLTSDRRHDVVPRLVELAENNVELNFDAIFKVALNDSDPEIRRKSIEGLWENEETSLIAPLLNLLANDGSDSVRAAAAGALGRYTLMAEHGKLRPQRTDIIKESLLKVAADTSIIDEVRRRALEAVAPLSVPEVSSAIEAAYRGQNQRLKASALYAMGRNCDTAWMPFLISELGSADPELRFESAAALGELGEQDAVPALLEISNDADSEVRTAVIQALGKIGGTKAKEYLQGLLENRAPPIREAARHALDELLAYEDPLSLHL